MRMATAALQVRLPELSSLIVSGLASKCFESLVAVRAITSQYRMTNKPAPTK